MSERNVPLRLLLETATGSIAVDGVEVDAWSDDASEGLDHLDLANEGEVFLDLSQEVEFCADCDGTARAQDSDGNTLLFTFTMAVPMTVLDLP